MTLTKEWLQQTIEEMEYDKATFPGDLNEDHGNVFEAMKMALAGMEAEPVAWLWSNRKHPSEVTLIRPEDDERAEAAQWSGWSCQALYSAPQPATAVDADDNFYSWFGREWADHYQPNQYTTAAKQMLGVMAESAWKAGRRDAMLQSGNHTEQHLDMVNSPVIPDDVSRMDWLVSKTVDVREPMAYGSHSIFWSQTITDEEDDYHATKLREQIDAAMAAEQAAAPQQENI